MLPHGITGKTMKLRRVAADGTVTEFDIQAQDLGHEHGITFSVDADVEDGDELTDTLPNGKTKTMRLREVQVREMPFPEQRKTWTIRVRSTTWCPAGLRCDSRRPSAFLGCIH
jgi:hypothetical protein